MKMVLALTGAYMVVQVVAGLYTGSLALLADAGHLLTDIGSLILALLAFWFSARPSTPGKTYGYYRSEILAGLVNGVLLVGISIFILYESWHRLANPPAVVGGPMLAVALLGLVVNLICARMLHEGAGHSLNVKAAYLEVMSDLLATLGVIAAAAIMLVTKWYLADPIISGLIGLMILPRTWGLLSECTNILMEGAPGHIDIEKLREEMLAVPGVVDVHDIHVWTITSGLDAMSGHVTIDLESVPDVVLSKITEIAQDDFGIHHTTIQVEQVECKGQSNGTCSSK
jgi:cobalt-zinc-cadmium efflux system protein